MSNFNPMHVDREPINEMINPTSTPCQPGLRNNAAPGPQVGFTIIMLITRVSFPPPDAQGIVKKNGEDACR